MAGMGPFQALLRWESSIEAACLSDVRYEAKGTFALVYSANLTLPDDARQRVALKVLRPMHLQRPLVRCAFINEACLHKSLRHRWKKC